ncbi:hypothetical protein E4U24_000078 [Claviceps purpurea]|nr:hypothetical protein E4U37_008036 [Claviceps purpurea]KAG6154102.1 hypothetical protein E4U11_006603 [Claviceps purpurea]KAG6258225.1 hypothetical protein E4U49_006426 [Claviceps purpurea]KAG6259762.1 hypothetical protein E4U24_000078 [Claviceps purpurea]
MNPTPRPSPTTKPLHASISPHLPLPATCYLLPANVSPPRAYKNLSPKTRLYFGIGVMAWGTIGLYLSDKAEEKYGFTPSEEDKEALWKFVPKVTVVERTGKEQE